MLLPVNVAVGRGRSRAGGHGRPRLSTVRRWWRRRRCIGDAGGRAPADPAGSVPVTVTGKLRLVPRLGSGLTALVGGVVSISQDVDSEPLPKLPYWSWRSAALMVKVYSPSAWVSPDRPTIA